MIYKHKSRSWVYPRSAINQAAVAGCLLILVSAPAIGVPAEESVSFKVSANNHQLQRSRARPDWAHYFSDAGVEGAIDSF